MLHTAVLCTPPARQRSFLFLNRNNYPLTKAKSCSKKTLYKRINIGTSKKERFENHIDKIVLDFDFIDDRQPVQILFFEHVTSHIFAMSELEQKAKKWETIVSQITNTGLKKTA